jgi:hypothetical protein
MTRLLEIASRLNPAQLAAVEDFAEFLSTRQPSPHPGPVRTPAGGIDVSGVVGLCAGMGGDRPGKELIREAWTAATDKYMKE